VALKSSLSVGLVPFGLTAEITIMVRLGSVVVNVKSSGLVPYRHTSILSRGAVRDSQAWFGRFKVRLPA